ncbi:uncharacterized protein [Palaemon carinicauda]|uniref:uncharacterized protein n=1 Tax=Palaemon carinicauda TaxID=392227 RepID=UPI0035B61F39
MVKVKVFLFLVLMVSVPTYCQDGEERVEQESDLVSNASEEIGPKLGNWIDNVIAERLNKSLTNYTNLHIPALPTLSYNDGNISVSLSLADIALKGLLDFNVTGSKVSSKGTETNVIFNRVYLDVGHYSSGGHLLNLPFAGEGPLLVAIHKLKIHAFLTKAVVKNGGFCVEENSALPFSLDLDQRRLEVKFSNMNPGADQGQLINIVLSSFGPDIIDYLNILLNGKDKEVAHRIVLDIVNTALCPDWVSNNPLDNEEEMTEYVTTIYRHFVEALKVPDQGFGIW